jgi:hypothetical protein
MSTPSCANCKHYREPNWDDNNVEIPYENALEIYKFLALHFKP